MKISLRTRLYLEAVADWKAAYEVAALLGDDPPLKHTAIKSVLGRYIGAGLVQWSGQNATYKLTPAGVAALKENSP
jgi:hypothetical protein